MLKSTQKEKLMDTIKEAIAAQRKYCDEKKLPHFAPSDGKCWCCHRNIYEDGYSVERASSELIIRCPHCYNIL